MEYWQAQAEADELLRAGEFERSLELYERALQTIPADHQRRYAVVSIYLGKAQALLGSGDAEAAHRVLEDLQQDDPRGAYISYPEYHETLIACLEGLGRDTRNARSQLAEVRVDWRDDLSRARELYRGGDYEESLIYFERSLNDNPGEWYSMSDVYAAMREKAEALSALGREQAAEALRAEIPADKR